MLMLIEINKRLSETIKAYAQEETALETVQN